MSKLSFRARQLDPSKPLPIYVTDELPDMVEYSAINRAVPQMPTGMEKEEETEHHLQAAICRGHLIPTPEVLATRREFYDQFYPANYKMPRQMIHMQPLGLETEMPEYDADSDDEKWLKEQSDKIGLDVLKFEQLMTDLERSSEQNSIKVRDGDEISTAVYDYWLSKRLEKQFPLIPAVKTENRAATTNANNPYVAFRRRTEKMQTRKLRKNDEASYERMFKLRREMERVTILLRLVHEREVLKRKQIPLNIETSAKRLELRDFSGAIYSELAAEVKSSRATLNSHANSYIGSPITASSSCNPMLASTSGGILTSTNGVTPSSNAYQRLYGTTSQQYLNTSDLGHESSHANGSAARREKRQYKKRKHKPTRERQSQQQQYLSSSTATGGGTGGSQHHYHHLHQNSGSPLIAADSNIESDDEENMGVGNERVTATTPSVVGGSESEDDSPFAFRRKEGCSYLRPRDSIGCWPWESSVDSIDPTNMKHRFTLTSINNPKPQCIGFARRRVGRGGRIYFDRVATPYDRLWRALDYTILESTVTPVPKQDKEATTTVTTLEADATRTVVVDLPTARDATKPHNKANASVSCVIPTAPVVADNGECEDDDSELSSSENGEDDENISRLMQYTSSLTLPSVRKRRRFLASQQNGVRRPKLSRKQLHSSGGKQTPVTYKPIPQKTLHDWSRALPLLSPIESDDKPAVAALSSNLPEVQQQPQLTADEAASVNKVNVIKTETVNEIETEAEVIKASSAATTATTIGTVNGEPVALTCTIKQELMDCDDSNEPLSSIQRAVTTPSNVANARNALDDEENVNLAQLCNIIKHTVKKEDEDESDERLCLQVAEAKQDTFMGCYEYDVYDDDGDNDPWFSTLPDVSRLRAQQRRVRRRNAQPTQTYEQPTAHNPNDHDANLIGSLSPTSSQRLEYCNDLLTEVRRDWLHFRPATPTDEFFEDCLPPSDCDEALLDWSLQDPISLELHRWSEPERLDDERDLFSGEAAAYSCFTTEPFKYTDIERVEDPLVQAPAPATAASATLEPSPTRKKSKLKRIPDNQQHSYSKDLTEPSNAAKAAKIGSSTFVERKYFSPLLQNRKLFCTKEKKPAAAVTGLTVEKQLTSTSTSTSATTTTTKLTLPASRHKVTATTTLTTATTTTTSAQLQTATTTVVRATTQATINQPISRPLIMLNSTPTTFAVSKSQKKSGNRADTAPATELAAQFLQRQDQSITLTQIPCVVSSLQSGGSGSGVAVGDIVNLAPPSQLQSQPNPIITSAQLSSLSKQQQQQPAQVQQQLQIHQLRQLAAAHQQHQQQQQQRLLTNSHTTSQMLTQYVTNFVNSNNNSSSNNKSGLQLVQKVAHSQPTLTPINNGSHIIYTTPAGELIAHSPAGQKIAYAVQKPSTSTSTSQLFTLANIKLQTAESAAGANIASPQASTANIITIEANNGAVNVSSAITSTAAHTSDSNQSTAASVVASTPATVSIINALNCQPLGVQQTLRSGQVIVARSNFGGQQQQLTQQQLLQAGSGLWRQLAAQSSVAVNTVDTANANKILIANRVAARNQANGPDTLVAETAGRTLTNRRVAQQRKVAINRKQLSELHLTKPQQQQTKAADVVVKSEPISSESNGDIAGISKDQHQQQQSVTITNNEVVAVSQQQQQKLGMNKLIKMTTFPANNAVSNHNYSLQPTTILSAPTGAGQANRYFIATSANAGVCGTSFQLATSTDGSQKFQKLHFATAAASASTAATSGTGTNSSSNSVTLSSQQENNNLVVHQQQQSQQSQAAATLVFSKMSSTQVTSTNSNSAPAAAVAGSVNAGQQQQARLKTADGGNKRVLYASLLNVKPISVGMPQTMRSRLTLNNSTIFSTNMRSLPIGSVVSSTTNAVGGVNNNNSNNVVAISGNGNGLSVASLRQLVAANNANAAANAEHNNNNNNSSSNNNNKNSTNVLNIAKTNPPTITISTTATANKEFNKVVLPMENSNSLYILNNNNNNSNNELNANNKNNSNNNKNHNGNCSSSSGNGNGNGNGSGSGSNSNSNSSSQSSNSSDNGSGIRLAAGQQLQTTTAAAVEATTLNNR